MFFDEAGQVSRLELGGHATLTDSLGKEGFPFTAQVSVEAGDPDDLLFDILGSDVYDDPPSVSFKVEGKVKVVRAR